MRALAGYYAGVPAGRNHLNACLTTDATFLDSRGRTCNNRLWPQRLLIQVGKVVAMRWTVLCLCIILAGTFISGCGDSGSTPTAQAPAAPPGGPPMPGGPPSPGGPANPGDGGAPAATTPPESSPNEGAPGAPGGDAPPMPTSGEPGQSGNLAPGGGTTDGTPPGDPNNP